jgi:hypothetical protein
MDKARKLNEIAEDFTLSHAVLATAKMIENRNRLSSSEESDDGDAKLLADYENCKGNLKKLKNECERRVEQENEIALEKVYISVDTLSSESTTEGARTYLYKRKMLPEVEGGKLSNSEHFEIILPPKTNGVPVLDYKNGKLSKKSVRFLVGHELGHLWLHLDEIRRNINRTRGTNTLPSELEAEANSFSFELSDLRDNHIMERAKFISKNKQR